MSEGHFDWDPGVGVGAFRYGDLISVYLSKFDLELTVPEKSSDTGWGRYEIADGEVIVWTEGGRIVGVRCEEEFVYKQQNLIGMTQEQLVTLMGEPDEIGDDVELEDGSVYTPYEYEDLALEVWFTNGKAVVAPATDIEED